MTIRPQPHVHGRDHEHGGADPTRIHWEDVGGAGTGGGLQFDVVNTGGWLSIETTGTSDGLPTGDGIAVVADAGDLTLNAQAQDVTVIAGRDVKEFPARDYVVSAGRDVTIGADRDLVFRADTDNDTVGLIILSGLPTTNPGVAGAIWNDAGTLKIS
jgi:hypothetical protein